MIDLYSFRNWLLRKLAGRDTVVINANVWARLDWYGEKPYMNNVTFSQAVPAGTAGSQMPPPPKAP